jgi:hypothetical protein
MRKFISILIILGIISGPVMAQAIYIPYDFETLTISSSALPFTASKITGTDPLNFAVYTVFTVNCASGTSCILRFTVNGTTPTASVGMRALYGDSVTIMGRTSVFRFRGIRENATDVIIDVTYFRR